METKFFTRGTDMPAYLAALLDTKGGLCYQRSTKFVHLQLQFSDPSIPYALAEHFGGTIGPGGRVWRLTRRVLLWRALEQALPEMLSTSRRAEVERVITWARLASYRTPRDPKRQAAWEALT